MTRVGCTAWLDGKPHIAGSGYKSGRQEFRFTFPCQLGALLHFLHDHEWAGAL